MTEQAMLLHDEGTGLEFIVVPGTGELCLTIHPTSLGEDDTRCIKVLEVKDTETGESEFVTRLPEYTDEEFGMWVLALRVATTVMAQMYGETQNVKS